jgi:hypothetical protein
MKDIKTYSTKIVDAMTPLGDTSIYYKKNFGFRKANLPFDYTDDEIVEYFKCERSPKYFIETYCTILTIDRYTKITLYDYQLDIIENYKNNKFNIVSIPRQAGISIIINLLALHEAMFGVDKQIDIFYPNNDTCIERIKWTKDVYSRIPFFLKAGTVKMSPEHMLFDNGCRISAGAKKVPGYNMNKVFIDNFAAISRNNDFLNSIFPAISALRQTKLFIASRQNSHLDRFREIFLNSLEEKNSFFPHYVFWWQLPGRDQTWKNTEIRRLGSEDNFNREYHEHILEWINIPLTWIDIKVNK